MVYLENSNYYLAFVLQEGQHIPGLFFLGTDEEKAYSYKVKEEDNEAELVDIFRVVLKGTDVQGKIVITKSS